MTMLPGQPRRRIPPLPPGWTHVTQPAPPASWSGLPPPTRAAPPQWQPPPRPVPAPQKPAGPVVRAERELGGAAKAIATAIGIALTILTMVNGLGGIIPPDAHEIVAIIIGGLTPLVVYWLPNWLPKGGSHDDT